MFLPSENKISEKINSNLFFIVNEIFKVSILTYFFLLLIDVYEPGFVSSYFELNTILYIVIASGLFLTFFKKNYPDLKNFFSNKIIKIMVSIVVGILTTILIYFQIKEIGDFSLVISIISGIIMTIISMSIDSPESVNN